MLIAAACAAMSAGYAGSPSLPVISPVPLRSVGLGTRLFAYVLM
jgi:hypothetical protein